MATNGSNGEHISTRPPPTPSPLRFSKFFQANMRILVTGGAGFIGSHLVDKLMENEKNEVIVADNFFTGSKDNLKKWIGHPRFELIRHDVTQPLLVEVDQIYHLACPASPIFYKHNPVKTIKTNVIGTLNMLGLAKRVGASGEPLTVQKPGTQTRSFCYVADMLINPEVTVTMTENTPDDPRQRKPDITKAKEVLGWEPKVVLRDGLVLMEDDFRERLAVPKKTKA
nr:unnamed protein product [Digitaria exilis]CAB3501236.1 unnamed protein product [Digitaria exilis]